MVVRLHGLASQLRGWCSILGYDAPHGARVPDSGQACLRVALALMLFTFSGCATVSPRAAARGATAGAGKAPADVPLQPNAAPLMPPPPRQAGKSDTFNITVNDIPLTDVLFVLARDAKLSLDISPRVTG